MKILQLRFKNLNSLSGEWLIDFTNPEYISDGIFAIIGPTGAGKSTILDAICLALYGRTPRLKGINKSANEIMSRQTGECFSEVTFETQAGKYRCHWSQHRARKKSAGKLADSKHEISELDSGQILESKKRDVAHVIEQKTGMDFERFTRSILLAQGGFAAFLQATADERAPILEQITGTEIYSEISKAVHERQREENAKLELIQAEMAGITILNDEDERLLKQDLDEKTKSEKLATAKNDQFQKSILWLNEIESLGKELETILTESALISNEIELFKPDREKLNNALKVIELESDYATLSSKRQQQKIDSDSIAKSEEKFPELKHSLKEKTSAVSKAENDVLTIKGTQKEELELIKTVRAFDLRINDKHSVLKTAKQGCQAIDVQVKETNHQQKKLVSKQDSSKKQISKIDDYLLANTNDALLISELTGINEQIKSLKISSDQLVALNKQAIDFKALSEDNHNKYTQQQKTCQSLQENNGEAVNKVKQQKQAIKELLGDRLLREYRAEYDSLLREMVYLKKIASLEQEREKLLDDEPCPLCGSLDHPYAEGNVPKIDETERQINQLTSLIKKAEQQESELKQLESKEKETNASKIDAEKLLLKTLHNKEQSLTNYQAIEQDSLSANEKHQHYKKALDLKLETFAIKAPKNEELDAIAIALKTRQEKWQSIQQQKSEIEENKTALESEIKSLEAIVDTLKESLKEKQLVEQTYKGEHKKLISERENLYGSKNPDAEETRIEKLVAESESIVKIAIKKRDKTKQQLNEIETQINSLKENSEARKPEIAALEGDFINNCEKVNIENEQLFLSYRLTADQRNQLSKQSKALDVKQADNQTRKKDRQSRLSQTIAKKITEIPLDDLKQQQSDVQNRLKMFAEDMGAIKQRLIDNTTAKAKFQQQQSQCDAHKKECKKWSALHSLIGSVDGKKFRNFAQGLTFELMVSHANKQLEKMTDRYLLLRDRKQPLELNVIDNYQAGEIRSTKNLSGGESFIVSLSLALGLSKMASRKVRVDSLFLDEGFGTLDEEALETALETLSGLQQDGKLIGIISHVAALKERINTLIKVEPFSGGKSMINGPGCEQVLDKKAN